MATLSITPTTIEPYGSYTYTLSGFTEGGEDIYIDFLSGPEEFGPYPKTPYRFPAANGSYTTNAPQVKGTYVARARQGTLLSNEVAFTINGAPNVWVIPALIAAGVVAIIGLSWWKKK